MRTLIAITLYIFCIVSANTQISINTLVNPPYSPYFEDYLQYDNSVIVIINNSSQDDLSIYFSASVTSDDTGIEAHTKASYRPGLPLIVPGNGFIQLQGGDFEEYLNFNNVDLVGITEQELIIADGLPEGYYKICVRAHDFDTGAPLSEEAPMGCSADILIQTIEPSFVILPICESFVAVSQNQNILFSWSISPGAIPGTEYVLQLTEVLEGQDPNDAFNALITPPFFERIVSTNSYHYGISDPLLEEGVTYAIRVQSFDPMERKVYKNNGFSEVCTFTYGEPEPEIESPIEDDLISVADPTSWDDILIELNNTTIRGKLNYNFKGYNTFNGFSGSSGTEISAIMGSFVDVGSTVFVNNNVSYTDENGGNVWSNFNIAADGSNSLISTLNNPIANKYYLHENTVNLQGSKPLKNMDLKLMLYFVYANGNITTASGEDYMLCQSKPIKKWLENGAQENYLLSDQSIFHENPAIPIASTTTNEDGSFEFRFNLNGQVGYLGKHLISDVVDWLQTTTGGSPDINTGPILVSDHVTGEHVYACLKIVVNDSQFNSPDIDIFAKPGDDITLPTQVALINSYKAELDIKAKADDPKMKKAMWPGENKVLENASAKVLRKTGYQLDLATQEIIESEGQQLNSFTTNEIGEFKNVVIDKSDANGKIQINRLVKYSPYILEVATRINEIETDYDYTSYNYKTRYETFEYKHGDKPSFNRFFEEETIKSTIHLNPKKPEIKGRVIEVSPIDLTGLSNIKIELLNQKKNEDINFWKYFKYWIFNDPADMPFWLWPVYSMTTDDTGFFSFKDLYVNTDSNGKLAGPFRRMKISKYGYNTLYVPPIDAMPWNLLYGQLKDIKDIKMIPKGKIKGTIKAKSGELVEAFIRVDRGAKYKTGQLPNQKKGEFEMLAESGQQVEIVVEPMSSKYFTQSFYRDINVSYGNTQDLGVLILEGKTHKANVFVKDDYDKAISGASVSIGGITVKTNAQGLAAFDFPSKADNFLLRITHTSGYAPLQEMLYLDESRYPKVIHKKLTKGHSIQGQITDEVSKQVLSGMRIFSVLNNIDNTPLIIETLSDKNGNYTLSGIPLHLSQIEVSAVDPNNPAIYAGATKIFRFDINPNSNPYIEINGNPYDFELNKMGQWALTEIWGFPAVITQMNIVGNEAILDGYLHNLPSTLGISTTPHLQIPFKNARFKINASGKPEPSGNYVSLDQNAIPLTINESFDGKLISRSVKMGNFYLPTLLQLTRQNDKAYISGVIKVLHSSFNFAYDFNGSLYLGPNANTPTVVAFSSTDQASNPSTRRSATNRTFSVFDYKNDVTRNIEGFDVFGFKGSADKEQSKLINNKINLNTTIHTDIPKCTPTDLEIKVGNIVISPYNIDINTSPGQKLNFNLEKWKVSSSQPWSFNKEEESFYLLEALIITGSGMDARIQNMRILQNELSEGELKLNGGITMGGAIDVKLKPGIKPLFTYDETAGTGHYRIVLEGASTSGKDVYVENIAGLPAGDRIHFSSFSLMSNGYENVSISERKTMFGIMDLTIDQVETGEGFVKFIGKPDFNIPKQANFSETFLKYTSPSKYTLNTMSGQVIIPGHVQFDLDNVSQGEYQTISQNRFEAYGDFYIAPAPGVDGAKVKLRGKLTRTLNDCRFDVIKVNNHGKEGLISQRINFGSSNSYMTITEGGLSLRNGVYENLTFDAIPDSYDGISEKSNNLHFEVLGDIKANSDALEVSDIPTPLGTMSMKFNFNEPSLTGSLHVTTPIQMGYATLEESMFTIRFDGNGYYLVMLGDIKIMNYPKPMLGGFILGNSSKVQHQHLYDLTRRFTVNPQSLPDQIKQERIKGIFLGGEQVLADVGPLLIPSPLIVPMWVTGKAGLGSYFNFDFGHSAVMDLRGYGFGHLSGSVPLTVLGVGCTFCVSANGYISINGQYNHGNLSLNACGTAGLNFSFCEASLGFDFMLEALYNNGFDVSAGLGTCSGQAHCRKTCP